MIVPLKEIEEDEAPKVGGRVAILTLFLARELKLIPDRRSLNSGPLVVKNKMASAWWSRVSGPQMPYSRSQ